MKIIPEARRVYYKLDIYGFICNKEKHNEQVIWTTCIQTETLNVYTVTCSSWKQEGVMMLNATFNKISDISCRSVFNGGGN